MIFSNYDSNNKTSIDEYAKDYNKFNPIEWEATNNYTNQIGDNYLISTKPQEKPITSDVTDVITNDRLNLLSTTIDHLTYQINKRAKLRDRNLSDLDDLLLKNETTLLNLDSFHLNVNPMIESKRTECNRTISQIRADKNDVGIRCWKDQSSLYTDLLKSIGEYKTIKRRSKILSGDYR